jgi:hypothetical protein
VRTEISQTPATAPAVKISIQNQRVAAGTTIEGSVAECERIGKRVGIAGKVFDGNRKAACLGRELRRIELNGYGLRRACKAERANGNREHQG